VQELQTLGIEMNASSRVDSEGLLSRREALSIIALAYPMKVAMETKTSDARLDSGMLQRLAPELGAESRDRLLRILSDASLRGQIPTPEVEAIIRFEHKSVEDLMVDLLPVAQFYSYSPLSHYLVGAVIHGAGGSLYLGTNIEVPHQSLVFAVHGEQCAISNALMHNESGVTALAVTAAPCGHCRQFLNELSNAPELKVLVKGRRPTTLARLLPESFGPGNLGVNERLFGGRRFALELTTPASDELFASALEAASRAYSPYTKSPSGVAVKSATNTVYQGAYIENAAYNPSLSPLQAALVGMIMAGEKFDSISAVTLVELDDAPVSQMSVTAAVLDSIAPAARLRRVTARLRR
jgi:cytidine deaminase